MAHLTSEMRVNYHLRPGLGTMDRTRLDGGYVYFVPKRVTPLTGKDAELDLISEGGIYVGKPNQALLLSFGEVCPRDEPMFLEVNPKLFLGATVSTNHIVGPNTVSPLFVVLNCFKRMEIPDNVWAVRVRM